MKSSTALLFIVIVVEIVLNSACFVDVAFFVVLLLLHDMNLFDFGEEDLKPTVS